MNRHVSFVITFLAIVAINGISFFVIQPYYGVEARRFLGATTIGLDVLIALWLVAWCDWGHRRP